MSSESLLRFLPVDAMPDDPLPSSGSLGPRFATFPGTIGPLRLPLTPSRCALVSLAPRYPSAISLFRSRQQLMASGAGPRAYLTRVPFPVRFGESNGPPTFLSPPCRDVPLSRTPAGSLRHRRSPSGCCLPRKEARRRPATRGRFRGCTSSGPSPRSPWLRTPGHPDARKVRYRPASGLWPGKTSGERETRPTGTYRGTMTSFMLLRQSPRLRLRVAQSFACLGPG